MNTQEGDRIVVPERLKDGDKNPDICECACAFTEQSGFLVDDIRDLKETVRQEHKAAVLQPQRLRDC